MRGALTTFVNRRIARIVAAVLLIASAGIIGVDRAGAVTSQPTFVLGANTIERGASTTWTSTFTMAEDAPAQATLNLPPGVTGTFDPACTAPGHTCTVSAAGVVTISNEPPPAVDPAVSVTISGTVLTSSDLSFASAEDDPMVLTGEASITLDQGGTALTSAPQTLTVTPAAATDVELTIDTTGPANGAPGPRGGTVSYTANITRSGSATALTQATTADVTLVADGVAPFVTTAPAGTTVAWAANEAGAKPVTLDVAVPADIPLGDTEAYHFVVTYDPNTAGGAAVDTETGESRSFTIDEGPDDAVISITNTAPAPGQDVVRGTSVTYTATLTRTGNLDQVTSVNVSLVPVGDQRGTVPGPATNVAFAIGDDTETASITVTVPTTATLGAVTYHFRARYDATGINAPPAAQDVVDGPPVSFDVVAAQPTFTLTPGDQTVTRGDSFDLVATLVNPAGAEPIIPGILTIAVPAGMSVGAPTATPGTAVIGPVSALGLVTVTYGVIEADTTKALTVPVTVLPSATKQDGPDMVATASFNAGVTDSSSFEIAAQADLTLSVDPAAQNIQKGKNAVVDVRVGNLGPEAATGTKTVIVTLTDDGGAGVDDAEIVDAPSLPPCTINPTKTQATCTIAGPIAANATIGIPITIRSKDPLTATLTASLSTTGTELDPDAANNANAVATVSFQQAQTDVAITAGPSPVQLALNTPTQDVTFNVANNDPDNGVNDGDPAEDVVVTVTIPAEVQATAAEVTGGACTPVPAGPGGQVVCTIPTIADGGSATITLTLQGTTLTAAPSAVEATLTSSTTIDTDGTNNSASVAVNVVKQPVDLSVNNNADAILRPTTPGGTTGSGDFTVTVTNNSAGTYTAGPYTVRVALDPAVPGLILSTPDPDCVADVPTNVVTCTGTSLGATPKSFVVHADITTRGPITVRSTVTLNPSATQEDPAPANNTDTWTVTRAEADLALTISPDQSIQKRKNAPVTVTLINNGPDTATGTKVVTINLAVPGTIQTAPTGAPVNCVVNAAKTQAVCSVAGSMADDAHVETPITVRAENAGDMTIVSATITTLAAESDLNSGNNGPVSSTVTFQESVTDVIVTASPPAAVLTVSSPAHVGSPTQNVTYTVAVNDPDVGQNSGDPAENVGVSITVPAEVRATAATFTGDVAGTLVTDVPCTVTAGSGNTVTCTIGTIDDKDSITITVTLEGTALLAVPQPATATATFSNNSPSPNVTPDSASIAVSVVAQPVDLGVNDIADVLLETSGPAVTTVASNFVVTVSNVSNALYTAPAYTVTIDVPGKTSADVELATTAASDPSCAVAANAVICTVNTPLAGTPRNFEVRATIKVPGPITVRSTVAVTGPNQVDPVAANNSDTWDITRNIPPNAVADIAPTVPQGSALEFKVLDNDNDLDAAEIPLLTVEDAPVGGTTAGVTVTRVCETGPPARCTSLRVVVAPTAAVSAAVPLTYRVVDPRGAATPVTLTLKIVSAVARTVPGSFNDPPPTIPNSFGVPVDPALLRPENVTPIDVLQGDLGLRSDGSAFPAGVDYDLAEVNPAAPGVNPNPASPHVLGSLVGIIPDTTDPDKSVVRYAPAKGYTSDPGLTAEVGDAPPDTFTYRTAGTKTGSTTPLFTLESFVTVEVRNQLPIGVDSTIDVFNSTTQRAEPIGNDIDGNSGPVTVTTSGGGSFTFNDQGEGTTPEAQALRPTIRCIGQVPTEAELASPDTAAAKCPSADPSGFATGWIGAGTDLVLQTPEGRVTVRLIGGNDPDAFRAMDITADATVVGKIDFAYVMVDNYGGASFARVTANVPNTPPVPIEGVRTVLKNTPTVVVDTKLAVQDINGDTIEISSTSPRTQHGTAVIGDDRRTITYTPDKDYLGPDTLIYNVSDGRADGAASAELQLNVVEVPGELGAAAGGGSGAGAGGAGGRPAGSLASTGGDPVPLTFAAAASLVLGLVLVHAGRRRQSRPLLQGARHLRT